MDCGFILWKLGDSFAKGQGRLRSGLVLVDRIRWISIQRRTAARLSWRATAEQSRRRARRARRSEKGRGEKKRSESSLATLRNSGAVNLSRRRHGVDGEMAMTREKEDTTMKRTTSWALGWCRISPEMHGCGGWWDSGEKIILGIPKQGASLWVVYIFVWSCHERLV